MNSFCALPRFFASFGSCDAAEQDQDDDKNQDDLGRIQEREHAVTLPPPSRRAASRSPDVRPMCVRPAWARWRRRRRRSRSDRPPQMPNFSPLTNAYSRQSRRTTQPRQTSFASRVGRAAFGEEQVGVDARDSWPRPASCVPPYPCGPDPCDPALLWPPAVWPHLLGARSRSCNYTDVILHYHKWFAQGGISKCRLAGIDAGCLSRSP